MSNVTLDEEGLFCALVLSPATYSRNRFFRLYQDPSMKRIRRRASLIRGLVRQLVRAPDRTIAETEVAGGYKVSLEVPSLGYRRTTLLGPIERDMIEYLLARNLATEPPRPAQARIESALARLAVGFSAPTN